MRRYLEGVCVLKTVRMRFEKVGCARFISHLDLMRVMIRAIRRAGLPIWYTEGFNRHPYIAFGAPLSLGYEGLRECLELRLLEDTLSSEEAAARLNAVLPEGLRIVEAFEARQKVRELTSARYRLTLGANIDMVQALLAAPVIEVEKRSKKRGVRRVDIRPALAEAEVAGAASGSVMEVVLACNGEEAVNPALIQQALGCEMRVLRLWLEDSAGNEWG